MRPNLRRILRTLLATLLLPLVVVAVLLLVANTGGGQRLVAWAVGQATGGQVVLTDLDGTLPFGPRIGRVELRDGEGAWLAVEGAELDLDPWRLLSGELAVESLTARSLVVARLPAGEGGGGGWPIRLPLRLQLEQLAIEDLDLDGVVPGAPRLAVEAGGAAGGTEDLRGTLLITAPGHSDRYRLEAGVAGGRLGLALAIQETPGGLLAALARSAGVQLPAGLADWRLDATADGPFTALALNAKLEAGPLQAAADGLIDLQARSATGLRLSADLPAMALTPEGRPPMAWERISLKADLAGPLLAPRGNARLEAKGLASGDWGLDRLTLDAEGDLAGLRLNGELALTRAPGPIVALLGPTTRLALAIEGEGDGWRISHARIDGARLKAGVQGLAGADSLALDWTLDLTDLGAVAPGWSGRVQAKGALSGTPKAPDLTADLDAQAAFSSAASGRLAGRVGGWLRARPTEPSGSLDIKGDWAGQPVTVVLRAERLPDGALNLVIAESRWASVSASGTLRLPPGTTFPQGEVWLRADRLADLAPLLPAGSGLAGRLTASLVLDPALARVEAQGEGLVLSRSVGIRTLLLDARVSEPQGAAQTQATLRVTGLAAGQVSGDLSLTARGPAVGLELTADAALATPMGPANLAAAGRLNLQVRRLGFQRLEASAKGETLRLLAPATLDLAEGVAVDRLRLGLGQGTMELAGRVTPPLDLDATVTRLPLELTRLVPGGPRLAGTLGAQIRLAGALDAPTGTIRVQASGLRLTEGAGRAIPAAEIKLSADLGARETEIDAQAEIRSRADLRLRGRIGGRLPLAPGALALRADGRMDLALLDPLLTGSGQQVGGQATLTTGISGTLEAPRLDGTLRLADAAIRDRTIGLSLTGVQGTLALAGDTVRVQRLVGQAGRGTLTIEGSVGVLAPGIPIDLRLVARNARPVQLDLIDVVGDADLRLAGRMAGRLDLSGSVRFQRIDIRLPERLPPTIAVLEVRERGSTRRPAAQVRRAPPAGALDLGFDLRLSAPRAVYVSGRGVDAELGGEVLVRGTQADPQIGGGFSLLRGEYKLIGQTLRFTRGRIGFDGAAVTDPTLDLEARVTAAGSTAILAVQGTARSPRIVLRGEPELPQDEVLARLLFGVAGGRLSAVQAARLGMAAASLAGIGNGSGPGVLDRARTGLGLDRLSIGTDERGDASLEGGRYIADGVYLGARQGARAGETQGVLRIEVTPQIRLEADVGAAGGTRGGAAYEREY